MDTEPTEVNLDDDYAREQRTHYTSVEKIVKKVFIDEKPLAAKIYKSEVEGVPIDREQKARAEFAAYSLLSQTALSEFTPEAQALIMDDRGRIIGLTVTWREGRSLSDLAPKKV